MNKILLTVSAGILLAACNQQTPATPSTEPQTQQEAMAEYQKIAQAVQSGQGARCLMTDINTGNSMTYYVKGEKVKMTNMQMEEADNIGTMIMDGEYLYTWSEETKEGTKMKLPDPEDYPDASAMPESDVPDLTSEEELQKYQDQGYRMDCNPENVADSEFIPPTDVTFMDMSSMMEAVNSAAQQGNGMTPEQQAEFERMMQQYGQ